MTVGEAIRAAAARLAHSSDTARLDAELLMAHALGCARSEMVLNRMRDPEPVGFVALADRRVAREPVALITGIQEFYGLDLAVTRDTLIPRGDSEVLIDAACERFADGSPERILDLGTGSGALLLAALTVFPEAEGVGIDASRAAVAVAADNARRLGLDRRARILEHDWGAAGWSAGLGRFDLILCNPPYVEDEAVLDPDVRDYEPASALFAGPEGLDAYRALFPQLPALLAPGGAAVVEIGAAQEDWVTGIARASAFAVELRRDLARRPRALICS